MTEAIAHDHHAHEAEVYSRTIFGFWVYIMTDCVLFSTLFATYAVLHGATFGGPSGRELFSLPVVIAETLFLLFSSFTCGLAMLSAYRNHRTKVLGWLALTFLFGLGFLGLELREFAHLIAEGNSWRKSAFLSSFFTLVGTHGAHITVGLLWMVVLVGQFLVKGITSSTMRRLMCFKLFWHFLDIVWIFIFTLVYLLGVI